MNRDLSFLVLVVAVVALFGVPLSTPQTLPISLAKELSPTTVGYGHIEDVPYVWQEINGYCYWSSVSMVLQYLDVPYNLCQFFAASGLGFSAAYIMIDDTQLFISASSYRQQQNVPVFCDLFGLEYEAYFDQNSQWIQTVEPIWNQTGFDIELLDGSVPAFEQMRTTIDEGYPTILWVDPYWLPAIDYVELREYYYPQDSAAPSSGHAIVVVGYNDTAQTVEILDPGVGAFGERYGYPDDGRYSYTANYSTLDLAWKTLGYGQVAFKPGKDVQNQELRIGRHIVDRLLGNRTSYAPDLEDIYFASFGEAAFRGIALDTSVDGIKNYLEQFNETIDRADILAFTGYSHELFMSLEYPAFRGALEALPYVLPSYDVSRVQELGRTTYPHFEAICTNDSLTDLNYRLGGSLLSDLYTDLADRYAATGDIESTLEAYSSEIKLLANHLLAIANAWEAAGEALERILEGTNTAMTLMLGISLLTTNVFVALVIILRRR